MTYGRFILFILTPAVVLSVLLLARRHRRAGQEERVAVRRGLLLLPVLVVVAVGYTTPWDRWLIQNGVWSYPPDSVIGTIASVPVEEYLFMIGQTVLTGCWTLFLTARTALPDQAPGQSGLRVRAAAGWLGLGAAAALWGLLDPDGAYFGAILLWFALPLALQTAVGADVLRAARRARLAGLSATLLLWSMDAVAIAAGAWRISTGHTVDLHLLGLPLEEGAFFLVTNMLIVNSVLLVSSPVVRQRMARRSSATAPRQATA